MAPWAVLGACGLEGTFGFGADDLFESAVKRAVAPCAKEVAVLADSSKIGMRARHKTLAPRAITHLVTDASEHEVTALRDAGIDIHHA
ncbi:DeoR/GlpR transcriptional regulator [Thioclava dalianensis]|uniref:DeoR/GlpR transcriptional regulator n=1 Tax=Thioclava dalianensis TaxID=1185766 RepID=UPI000941EF47|nr:DeoR/GlpR transcriptional regulator [Thioclava dalianensis]